MNRFEAVDVTKEKSKGCLQPHAETIILTSIDVKIEEEKKKDGD